MTKSMVKAKVLHALVISAFTGNAGLQQSQVPPEQGESLEQGRPSPVEHQARLLLNELDIHRYMGPDGMHPEVPVGDQKLASVAARPLLIIFERSRQLEEIPMDWEGGEKTSVTCIFVKEDPGSRLLSLTFILGR